MRYPKDGPLGAATYGFLAVAILSANVRAAVYYVKSNCHLYREYLGYLVSLVRL